jgi:hypothetical protein
METTAETAAPRRRRNSAARHSIRRSLSGWTRQAITTSGVPRSRTRVRRIDARHRTDPRSVCDQQFRCRRYRGRHFAAAVRRPRLRVPHVFPTRQIEAEITPSSPTYEPLGRAKIPANPALIIRALGEAASSAHVRARRALDPGTSVRLKSGVQPIRGHKTGTHFAEEAGIHSKGPRLRAFSEAAEGTRTLDLLHGKQTL